MAQIDKPGLHFNTLTWTGDGNSSRNITGVGFQPDWVWGKCTSTTVSHALYDAVRGGSKLINSDTTSAEGTNAALSAFISDGFTVNSDSYFNANSATYVAWNWKANGQGSSNTDGSLNTTYTSVNTTAGLSISKYTGTGSSANYGHGLGVAPKVIMTKNLTSGSAAWRVSTTIIDGSYDYLHLNTDGAKSNDSVTAPTSSLIYLDNSTQTNTNSQDYISYAFAEKKGYSKFGSYTGNGNADGTFIYTGFKPALVIIKQTNTTNHWYIWDNKRDLDNPTQVYMRPDTNMANGSYDWLDFVSNGIKIRNTSSGTSTNGGTYIYMAWAENPIVGSNNVPAVGR